MLKKVGKAAIFTDKSSDLISGNTPKKTTLDILTKTIYKGKIATIKAILKDEDGNLVANTKIQLKINGKLYYATTNSKGVATFKISSLKVGKFRVTADYVGNTALLKSSNTKYQVVKGIPDLIIKKSQKNRAIAIKLLLKIKVQLSLLYLS
ncbi:Ig-like domain-containing protein [Methanobrevibacter arboriphilus]|uniref:Ig-like domain-containing protein n=1 Tax=Methanobrevibacter arboriphilus TaxID=39441 RepID=UPI000A9CBAFB|nr:Ig-like domain-containing protein [Methanobrevibacter arboriphilus]